MTPFSSIILRYWLSAVLNSLYKLRAYELSPISIAAVSNSDSAIFPVTDKPDALVLQLATGLTSLPAMLQLHVL
ncbi:MAG: hypothetical protein V3V10_04260 [Planctomycetota bacterium]